MTCDFWFQFPVWQTTVANQKPLGHQTGLYVFPKVLHVLDYDKNNTVSDNDDCYDDDKEFVMMVLIF